MRTLFLIFCLLFLPSTTSASLLEAQVIPGTQTSRVIILLGATTTPINAIEGTLTLPSSAFSEKLYIGQSVIQTWIEPPVITGDTIRFAGIIPGGFTGSAIPGSGLTGSAPLFSFEITGPSSPITLSGATAYLHDGRGTKIVDAGGVLLETRVAGVPEQEEDRTPPEFVDAQVTTDSSLFDGRPALLISGFDAGSGIDRFEVQEGSGSWAQSSYVYEIQDRYGFESVSVRAYDRAGNFIETRIPGRNAPYLYLGYALLALLLLSIVSGTLVYWKKRRART